MLGFADCKLRTIFLDVRIQSRSLPKASRFVKDFMLTKKRRRIFIQKTTFQ